MEFSKALKEALGLGISKEEFMYVWEKEMDLQILNQNVNNYGHGNNYSANIEAIVIEAKKLPEMLHFEIENLKIASQELQQQQVNLSKEIISQSQELMNKLTLTANQHQNNNLNLILESVKSIKAETQTLKTHFDLQLHSMAKKFESVSAELKSEIFEIKQKILAPRNHSDLSEVSSVASHTVSSDSTEENVNIYPLTDVHNECPPGPTRNELYPENNSKASGRPQISKKTKPFIKSYKNKTFFNYPKVKEMEPKVKNKEQNTVDVGLNQNKVEKEKHTNPVKTSESTLEKSDNNTVKQNNPVKISESTVPESANNTVKETNAVKSSDRVLSEAETTISSDDAKQATHAHCTESDVSDFAEKKQTAQTISQALETSEANDVSKYHNVHEGENIENTAPATASISTRPTTVRQKQADYGLHFTIPESHSFYNCGEDFYTDYFQVKDFPCIVQMRLRLAKDGKILVSALISFLEHCEEIFPVCFEGNGYISARLSGGRGYTQIWTLESKLYKMPVYDKDYFIDAHVCLKTNRNSYKNITYDRLVDLGYDKDKQLQFYWEFAGYSIYYC